MCTVHLLVMHNGKYRTRLYHAGSTRTAFSKKNQHRTVHGSVPGSLEDIQKNLAGTYDITSGTCPGDLKSYDVINSRADK